MTGTVGRGRYVFFSVAQAAATVGILSFLVWSFGLTPFVNAVMRLPPWTYPAGIGLGALGCIVKPFDPLKLPAQIEQILKENEKEFPKNAA